MNNGTESILAEAARAAADREPRYGPPLVHFASTAAYWTQWLRSRGLLRDEAGLGPFDIAPMFILDKVARESHCPIRDNPVDWAGYADAHDRVVTALDIR